MGLTVYHSSRIEALASHLARRLAEERRAGGDPFVPQTLLVPNPHVASWLKIRIGGEIGLAANLRFPFLEEGLWRLTLDRLPPEGRAKVRLLKREEVHLLILAELIDPSRLDRFPVFRDYLSNPPGLSERGRTARAWQLAERLSKLFSDYEYHREGMIEGWLANPGRGLSDPIERSQRDLYLSLFGAEGSALRTSDRGAEVAPRTLPQLARLLAGESARASRKPDGGSAEVEGVGGLPVHLFGFSQLSPFHFNLLFEAAVHREVSLYQFNLSFDPLLDRGEAPSEGPDSRPGPVEFWGQPGAEFVQLLKRTTELFGDRLRVETLPVDSPGQAPPTLLGALQNRARTRRTAEEERTVSQDVSLQVVGCPGRHREVEAVHQSILENLRLDPDLKLADIAVLVTDMRVYQPILEAVFNPPNHCVPYNLRDSTAERDSLFAQGILQLLDLVGGRLTRREVFDFLFNPLAREALGVSREEVRQWLEWAAALNVYESAPADGDRPEEAPFSWRWGFRRLELGRWMETLPPDRDGCLPNYRGVVPYSDLDSLDSGKAGAFIFAVDSLATRLAAFSRESRSASDWIENLENLVETHLRIPSDDTEEVAVRESLFRALPQLALLEKSGGGKVSFEILHEFVRGHLENLPSRRGRYAAGGVTLSSMRPLRPIPFKAVYLIGLDEGRFPGAGEDSTLDLRTRGHEVGDVSVPEANRHLFLETLMVTGQKLYLTYPNRDLEKDREIAPCSTVEELKRIAAGLMGGVEFRELALPISGASLDYLKPRPEWADMRINFSTRDRFLCLLALAEMGELGANAGRSLVEWADRKFPEAAQAPGRTLASGGEIGFRIEELKRFLENPLEAAIRRHLDLRDEEVDDLALAEDEPILSGFPMDYEILTAALSGAVLRAVESGVSDSGDRLKNLYEGKSHCGEVPAEVFGSIDREAFASALEGFEQPSGKGLDFRGFLDFVRGMEFHEVVQIGESTDAVERRMRFAALNLPLQYKGQAVAAVLQGSLPRVWRDDRRIVALVLAPTSDAPAKSGAPPKQVLAPYLFHLTLQALECEGGEPFVGSRELLVAVQFKKEFRLWRFGTPSEGAGGFLAGLVEDLAFETRFERLPFQAFGFVTSKDLPRLLDLLRKPDPTEEDEEAFLEIFDEAFEKAQDERNCREMELAELFEAPRSPRAFAIARKRLLPFLGAEGIAEFSEVDR